MSNPEFAIKKSSMGKNFKMSPETERLMIMNSSNDRNIPVLDKIFEPMIKIPYKMGHDSLNSNNSNPIA